MELFRLLGTIAVDSSGANNAIDEVTDNAERSQGRIGKAFDKIGSAAVKVGKTMAAGFAVASAAVGALAKEALEGYADYEQLVGGVETLFGAGGQSLEEYAATVGKTVDEVRDEYNGMIRAQQAVLQNADKAYKTAGMSANDYMETVTSFSAALIQSLNGNTEAAAEKANQAIVDMSDNANKMGSSMESIQNAYQGFAKQNYTMLDNLKLGYGGTKEEMARLLADAQAISGIEYDISSYADIVDAIHVIQEEMGIAGTTAKEASSTITGSVDSAKSAWANLITGIADEGANLPVLVNNFVDSVITAAGNIVPRLQIILEQIGQLAGDMFVKAFDHVSTEILKTEITFEDVSTKVKTTLSTIWQSIQNGFAIVQPVLEEAKQKFKDISENVIKPLYENYISNLIAKFKMLVEIWETAVLPVLRIVIDAFLNIVSSIYKNVEPAIKKIMEKFNELSSLIRKAIKEYIVPVIESFISMILELYEENKEKLELIGELFGAIFEWISDVVSEFVEWFKDTFLPFLEEIRDFVQENMDKIKGIFQNVINIITGIIQAFIALFKGDWTGLWESVKSILENAFLAIRGVFELIGEAIGGKVKEIAENVSGKFEEIKTNISDKLTAAKDKVLGIFDSIKQGISDKINAAKDAVSYAIERIKGFFNFNVSLPQIKLPHFSISPSGWQLGDLLEGVIPSLGIDWYAKGGVMEEPTVFGMNGNKLMAGGEAGPEAIAPIDVLLEYITQAVASQNTALIAVLQQILEAIVAMDENMGGNLREALEGTAFEMNHREFARLVKAVN